VDVVEILLEHWGRHRCPVRLGTPLFLAASSGHIDVERLLLKRGADTQIREMSNLTPFQVTKQKGHTICAGDIGAWCG
jgi:ankyrin repeat protein